MFFKRKQTETDTDERAYWRAQREEARRREIAQRAAMLAERHERGFRALLAMQAARAEFEALAATGAVDVDTARDAWETLLQVEQWLAEEVL